jgi:hypothetical protein
MNENTPAAELLPCPMCGDTELDGGIYPADNSNEWFVATCGNQSCRCSIEGVSVDDVRQRWNRRPSPAQPAREWQPIETATIKPFDKDNWYMPHSENVLLWRSHACIGQYGYTKQGKGRWRSGGFTVEPTHWMPLPDPPISEPAVGREKL